jgi:hypothetical protein
MPCSSVVELRTVPPLNPENDVTVYIVVEDFGDLGRSFRETDIAEADHDTIVRNMISGEYNHPLRVVAFNTVEGWSRDVSGEIAYDVLGRAYDADTTLGAGAKRCIDLHVTTGVKRPRRRRYCANKFSRPARRREGGIDFADLRGGTEDDRGVTSC